MRYLLTTAVLAFCIAGTGVCALADPAASQSPATVSAPASGASTAAQAASGVQVGDAVSSPDVADWTAQYIIDQRAKKPEPRGLGRFAGRILARTTTIARSLTKDALRFLGTPYVFGGTSRSGFDCSGFVQHVFAMLGMRVPRTADAQYDAGHRVRGGIKPGDLVFFQTYTEGPSHVGIYLGHGKFVHASSSHGVMVSNLSDAYWANRYIGAKRMIAQR